MAKKVTKNNRSRLLAKKWGLEHLTDLRVPWQEKAELRCWYPMHPIVCINLSYSHTWISCQDLVSAPSCWLELFHKLQNQIYRLLVFFYRYCFGRCSSEMVHLVPFPYSRGRSTCYSGRLHNSSVIIPRCYKDVFVNSFSF